MKMLAEPGAGRYSTKMMDPYRELGISPDATEDEIKGAYRKLAKMYHPDANPRIEGAAEKMNRVNTAYRMLREGPYRFEGGTYGGWSRSQTENAYRGWAGDFYQDQAGNYYRDETGNFYGDQQEDFYSDEDKDSYRDQTDSTVRKSGIFYNPVFRRVVVIGIAVCMIMMGILSSFYTAFWADPVEEYCQEYQEKTDKGDKTE